jgi:hypothetical protein
MFSIREQVLREVVLRLTNAVAPVSVLRMPVAPVTREASPALLVFAEGDGIAANANGVMDRALTLRLVAIARDDTAFDTADQLIVEAHRALLIDSNLGGLCLGMTQLDCEWDVEDADNTAVAIPARFEIRYRTLSNDLTKTG